MSRMTFCISTYNNNNYLQLAIKSVRENSYFKDAPFVIHAENCTDGTNEWLEENKEKYNLEIPDNPIHDGGWLCDSLTAITYNKESFYGQKHTRIDAISFEIEVEENE